jgi:hypothetical protein
MRLLLPVILKGMSRTARQFQRRRNEVPADTLLDFDESLACVFISE